MIVTAVALALLSPTTDSRMIRYQSDAARYIREAVQANALARCYVVSMDHASYVAGESARMSIELTGGMTPDQRQSAMRWFAGEEDRQIRAIFGNRSIQSACAWVKNQPWSKGYRNSY